MISYFPACPGENWPPSFSLLYKAEARANWQTQPACPPWFTSTKDHALIAECPLGVQLYAGDDQPSSPRYLFQTTLSAPSMLPSKINK